MSIRAKKKFSKFLLVLQIIIFSPIIFLIFLITPFVKIRIFELETRLIGHYTLSVEIFLSELKANIHNFNGSIFLYYTNNLIVNKFLFNKWKKIFSNQKIKFYNFPQTILRPIHIFLRYFKIKKYLAPYRHWADHPQLWQRADTNLLLGKYRPHIVFDFEENKIGMEYLKKNNIQKGDKYICIISRNSNFHKDKDSYRNMNINNFLKMINYFGKRGYKILIMGSKSSNKILKNKSYLIDYANSPEKSDFLDIYLLFNSYFTISADTGLRDVLYLNRKPLSIINFISTDGIIYDDYTKLVSYFIPKKYFSIKKKKYITYSEAFKLNLQNKNISELQKLGFKIIENSDDEILNICKETEKLVKQKFKRTKLDNSNLIFRNIIKKYFRHELKNLRLSKYFIKKNKHLIN